MMNPNLSGFSLIAQFSSWKHLGDGLHKSSMRAELADLVPVVTVLAVLGIIAFVAVKLQKRNDFSRPCNDANKLFRQLCLVHGLNSSSRRLLIQLANAWEMSNPATLFVTPSAFRASELPEWLQGEADGIAQLAKKLF